MQSTRTRLFRRLASAYVSMTSSGPQKDSSATAPASSTSTVCEKCAREERMPNVLLVEFRMIVFRPFKGEVMIGRIRSSTPAGINLRTDFSTTFLSPSMSSPRVPNSE